MTVSPLPFPHDRTRNSSSTAAVPEHKAHQYKRSIDLDVDIGADAVDYNAIAKQESLSGLEVEMRKLEGVVKEIVDELNYLKRREARMRDTNGQQSPSSASQDITHSLVWWDDRIDKRQSSKFLLSHLLHTHITRSMANPASTELLQKEFVPPSISAIARVLTSGAQNTSSIEPIHCGLKYSIAFFAFFPLAPVTRRLPVPDTKLD
jgi:hypothetical protein